jgi:DNA recombination-mediator protein A
MTRQQRQMLAYWLTLAFRLEREPRRAINGLVLTADRRLGLSLLDLVRMDVAQRPADLARYAATLDRLIDAEANVSAQAFLVERVLAMGGQFVPVTDPSYPAHLVQQIGVDRAPTLLSVIGNPELFATAGVAVSGSRKAGSAGLTFAREAGRAVAEAGEVLICGLAAGVDREALEGALEAGGRAVGIAPEGLLRSRWLYRPEVRDGRIVVVSEFAPDDTWTAGRAMARNRTIAGFSKALVIADCVASGGTTDQLEVHRGAGMPVYVRRGPGQGALVEELCRRPGVTPWDWASGRVVWPPASRPSAPATPVSDGVTCNVRLEADHVTIRLEAPRQLELRELLGLIEAEYLRAVAPADLVAAASTPQSGASENAVRYGSSASDPVLVALERAGTAGRTAAELERELGTSKGKVGKRLRELADAKLIAKGARRHSYVLGPPSAEPPSREPPAKKVRPAPLDLFAPPKPEHA